jgi:hypothetical protein
LPCSSFSTYVTFPINGRFSVSRAANTDAAGNQQGLNDGSTGMLQVSLTIYVAVGQAKMLSRDLK